MPETIYSKRMVLAYFGEAWSRGAASLASFHPRQGAGRHHGPQRCFSTRHLSLGDSRAAWQCELRLGFRSGENREELGSTLPFIVPRLPYLMRRLISCGLQSLSPTEFDSFGGKIFFRFDGVQRCYVQDESAGWSPEEEIRQLAVRGGEKDKKRKGRKKDLEKFPILKILKISKEHF
jgi:hypothetical protein